MTVKRPTAFVLAARVAAASMDPDAQPGLSSVIQVAVQGGTDNTGTVTVTGTVDGAPDSEVLTIAGALTYLTTKRFSTIDTPGGFTSTGLTDEATVPTISAKAVGASGDPHNTFTDLITGFEVALDRNVQTWPGRVPGTSQEEQTWIYFDATDLYSPKSGDVFVDESTLEEWEVYGPTDYLGSNRATHHELRVRLRDGSV